MNVIDEYMLQFPIEKQEVMQLMRAYIKETAPEASEKISWGMPTFYLHGNLVHFAMNKAHIGFYPGEHGVSYFEDRLTSYKHSKGAIQFPLDKPLPKELIQDIVAFRVEEQHHK